MSNRLSPVPLSFQPGCHYLVGSIPDAPTWKAVCATADIPCDLVELRVDSLSAPIAEEQLLAASYPRPVLLTIRHQSEGGCRELTDASRLEMAFRLLPMASVLDWEIAQLEKANGLIEAAHAAGIPLIASAHNFEYTPELSFLQEQEAHARQLGADVVKFAFRLNREEDLTVGVNLLRQAQGPMAVMGMGWLGPVSRLLYAQLGSCLTYGYLGNAPTAPGQWSAALFQQAFSQLDLPAM